MEATKLEWLELELWLGTAIVKLVRTILNLGNKPVSISNTGKWKQTSWRGWN